MERIAMSTKEVLRGSILAQVMAGTTCLRAAARQLAVSYRHAKRLYRRYKAAGRVDLFLLWSPAREEYLRTGIVVEVGKKRCQTPLEMSPELRQ